MPDAVRKALPMHRTLKPTSPLFTPKKIQTHFILPVQVQELPLQNQSDLILKRASRNQVRMSRC